MLFHTRLQESFLTSNKIKENKESLEIYSPCTFMIFEDKRD